MKYILVLFLIVNIVGCASYRAFEQDISRPAHTRLNKQEKKGLVLAAEDYSESQKSIKYFDEDLQSEGYIPIYLCVGNNGDYEFTLRLDNITFLYEDGTEAEVVRVGEVIETVSGGFDLARDYEQKALHDSNITKGDNIFGFIFVKVPQGQEETSAKDSIIKVKAIKKAYQGELAETLEFVLSVSES